MPKIFLIKKRLHEQQLGLQEGLELLASKSDPLCPGSPLDDGPIALLSKKDKDCIGKCPFVWVLSTTLFSSSGISSIYITIKFFYSNIKFLLSVINSIIFISLIFMFKSSSLLFWSKLLFLFIISFLTATCSPKKKILTLEQNPVLGSASPTNVTCDHLCVLRDPNLSLVLSNWATYFSSA